MVSSPADVGVTAVAAFAVVACVSAVKGAPVVTGAPLLLEYGCLEPLQLQEFLLL